MDYVEKENCIKRTQLIDDHLLASKEVLDRVDKAITGNGKPETGIQFRMLLIERSIKSHQEFIDKNYSKKDGYVNMVVTIITRAVIIGLLVKLGLK